MFTNNLDQFSMELNLRLVKLYKLMWNIYYEMKAFKKYVYTCTHAHRRDWIFSWRRSASSIVFYKNLFHCWCNYIDIISIDLPHLSVFAWCRFCIWFFAVRETWNKWRYSMWYVFAFCSKWIYDIEWLVAHTYVFEFNEGCIAMFTTALAPFL